MNILSLIDAGEVHSLSSDPALSLQDPNRKHSADDSVQARSNGFAWSSKIVSLLVPMVVEPCLLVKLTNRPKIIDSPLAPNPRFAVRMDKL